MKHTRSIHLLWALILGFAVVPCWLHCQLPTPNNETSISSSDAGVPETPTGSDSPSQDWQTLILQTKDSMLVDAKNRQILLRGMNARVEGIFDVSFDDGRKSLEPIPSFTASDCKMIAEQLGQNLLRLPIHWSGIEPKKGQYQQTYLDRIWAVVDTCYRHGVYTLLDLHQDAYSKEIGEDGAPLWAIIPPPEKLLEGPLNDLGQRRTSKQVLAAFASFFTNQEGLQDAYAAMATHLAQQSKNHPGVIGLEIMNEPVLFGDNKALDAFHHKVTEQVRKAHPSLVIFFEPNSLRNLTDHSEVTTPFPFANGVYSPHIYTQVFQNGWASGDVDAIRNSVKAAQQEANTHKTPMFVGEFGHNPNTEKGRIWITETLNSLDNVKASWAFWVYEEWSQGNWGLYDVTADEKRGALRKEAVQVIARPFPAKTAGRILSLTWNPTQRILTAEIENPSPEWHEWTVPKATFPQGIRVSCDGINPTLTHYPGRVWFPCQGKKITLSANP